MEFSNTYITLGEAFYQKCLPTPVTSPALFLWHSALAKQLGFTQDDMADQQRLAQLFSGNDMLSGADPIACVYAGHQFGHFNPQLGDGRAHLLGEIVTTEQQHKDIQLKGSGPTVFSRSGDGRCAIGPAIREFIMSAALKALGVPTTECLAVVTTGEPVYRETPLPGAVVTRIAASHLRVGTFQYFAARSDRASLAALADYAIKRHYPEVDKSPGNRFSRFLDKVIDRQITLIVEWMRIGFIHGVMNTDNTAISGETIDYGPCAMMDTYDPNQFFSAIDTQGRYAFSHQPRIAHWNMTRFAECLWQLVDKDDKGQQAELQQLIDQFESRYQAAYLGMMSKKFGFLTPMPGDDALITSLLAAFSTHKVDYTAGFFDLQSSLIPDSPPTAIEDTLGQDYTLWRKRLNQQTDSTQAVETLMQQHNPVIIPRNHQMEAVIESCIETGKATAAIRFFDALQTPYTLSDKTRAYQSPPARVDTDYQTFCGT